MAVQRLVTENRTYTYGIDVSDPERIPRGPYFIKQPIDATFDTSKRKLYNDISLRWENSVTRKKYEVLREFLSVV